MIILANERSSNSRTIDSVAFKKARERIRTIVLSTGICVKLRVDTKQYAAIMFDGDRMRIRLLSAPFYQGTRINRICKAGSRTKARVLYVHERLFPEASFPTALHEAEVVRGTIVVKIPGCEKAIKRILSKPAP